MHIEASFKFCRNCWGEKVSRENSEYTESCLIRSAPSLDESSGDTKGDLNVLLAVPEFVPEGVKRPSGLDFEDSSRLSTPDTLLDEDVEPNSGEATVGEGSQGLFVFVHSSPGFASNGISRILPGVRGSLSQSFCFPSCFGDVYGGNVASVSDRLGTGSLGMSTSWAV